jgi:hypothetical protein
MHTTVSKSALSWSRDYTFENPHVQHPWIARVLRLPYKVINGCANPQPMLVRYRLLETPIGSLNLHHFLRGDEDRDLHDHPFAFATLILSGGYVEQLPRIGEPQSHPFRYVTRRPGSILFRSATWIHRVDLIRDDAWTLIAMSRKTRDWGFFTKNGWKPFWKYFSTAGCADANTVVITRTALAPVNTALTTTADISPYPLLRERRDPLAVSVPPVISGHTIERRASRNQIERRNRKRRLEDLETVDLFPATSLRAAETALHEEIKTLQRALVERDTTIAKQKVALKAIHDYCRGDLLDKVHHEPSYRTVYRNLMSSLAIADVDVPEYR